MEDDFLPTLVDLLRAFLRFKNSADVVDFLPHVLETLVDLLRAFLRVKNSADVVDFLPHVLARLGN